MKLVVSNIRYHMALRRIDNDAELSRRMGWSKAKVSRVLSGKQEVRAVIVEELAKELRCKEADIVELEDVAQTPFEREVLSRVKSADPSLRAAIHAMLKVPEDVPPNP